MQGLATGNRAGKPKLREQEVLTPLSILDVCEGLWGGIELDPCAAAQRVIARRSYVHPEQDGLTGLWVDQCYVNPPYKDLKKWLRKSTSEDARGVHEQVLLFPVRPNRVWWCEYMHEVPTSVAWLKPLKFKGYSQAFPAPLVLVYTGYNIDTFEELARPLACYIGGPL